MGIFSKIFGKGKLDFALSLDIGTEVAKALVFKVDAEEKKCVVIGAGKVQQKTGNMQSGAVSDIAGVIETSRQAIDIAKEKAGIKKVKNAIVGIAGELVKGTTTTVHYERVNPQARIELSELKNIIQKVQTKAFEKIKNQMAWEVGQSDIDVKLINAAVSDVRIDGYQVSNPLGFQGRDVSIGVFNAYAPMIHLGALETIAGKLGVDLLSIVAEPYAVARSVGFEGEFDFGAIFIDVGGGTTDIAVVRNGGLEGTKIFALGGRAFTKRLARGLSVGFEEAEALKIKYSEGKLGMESRAKIEEIMEEDCRVWLNGVELSLSEFSQERLLPSKIFLCGGGSGLPQIKRALATEGWIRNLSFAKSPSISYLQPRDIARVADSTGELNTPQDITPMGLANLAIDFMDEEKVMSGILKRAMDSV